MEEAVGAEVGALRRYVAAALAMDDELSWTARSLLAPAAGGRGVPPALVTALDRFAAANRAADEAVLRVAHGLAAADAGGLLSDDLGWFTLAGASKRVLSAAEAQRTFTNVMADLHRPGSHLPGGTAGALEWEVRHHARFLSDAGHYRKVESAADALRRVLRSEALRGDDLARATEELRRLERAKALADEAATRLGKTPAQMLKDFPRVGPAPAGPGGGGFVAALGGAARAATGLLLTPFLLLLPSVYVEAHEERERDLLA
jgi:hypothetical protein